MNIKYIDNEAKFYFICEYCGTPIKDNKGVVDFPLSCSNNIKAPLRFYHRGNCASYGNKQRVKNKWGCWNLDEFLENLLDGELPDMIKFMQGSKK